MNDIRITRGLLEAAGETMRKKGLKGNAAIISDETVYALYGGALTDSLSGAGFTVSCYTFPPGEASKTMATYGDILRFLSGSGITRSDTVVALGGGVVGDIAGFAAATWLRGVKLVQIPTTLLAMVDSSVGGKTAIDLPEGKNLVGAFYQPHLVLIDPGTLHTLPPSVRTDGMAEVIKYGALCDKELFDLLPFGEEAADSVIARCVAIKQEIVGQDERDFGVRQLLNFGHTFGHAMEKLSGYTLPHGQAVAMGMALMARACAKEGLLAAEACRQLIDKIAACGLPTQPMYPEEEVWQAMGQDKKRMDGGITLVLIKGIGQCYLEKVSMNRAREILRAGYSL